MRPGTVKAILSHATGSLGRRQICGLKHQLVEMLQFGKLRSECFVLGAFCSPPDWPLASGRFSARSPIIPQPSAFKTVVGNEHPVLRGSTASLPP